MSQCFESMSAGLCSLGMWKRFVVPAAIASLVLWQDKITWRLLSFPSGLVAALTTASLSPNAMEESQMGTPRHRRTRRSSMICSVQVLVATNSDPKVAVSAVDCNLENQSMGVCLVEQV